MSVIAKMNVCVDPRSFGTEQLVELSCVCDDQLMAGNDAGRANENRTFNTASPSGDARVNLDKEVQFRNQEEVYLIFLRQDEVPEFKGAIAVVEARVVGVTDFGGTSKRVEVCSTYRYRDDPKKHPLMVSAFNLRMSIDNPTASIQFVPGAAGYWIGLYRCSDMTMTEALGLAHG